MKKFFYLVIAMIPFFTSCSDDIEENEVSVEAQSNKLSEHQINKDDALGIVKKYFKGTRSIGNLSYNYVLTTDGTRAEAINNDTIAHIFNMGDNDGFMVISSDNRIAPILAFSDNGHFSYEENENDMVYVNFIQRLEACMDQISETDTAVIVPQEFLDACVIEESDVKTKWGQRDPFNKYVIQDHPNCLVGCVAVATGQIMVACKDSLTYHGNKYYFKSMENAFILHENPDAEIKTKANFPVYDYNEAVDKAAYLLKDIGIDVHMRYNPLGSGAGIFEGYKLLKKLNYTIKEKSLTNYVDTTIAKSIDDGNIIYMRGSDLKNSGGHAWVVSGCMYCWKDFNNHNAGIQNVYLNCNWGWDGDCDGYYNGDIFNVENMSFGHMQYFSVKKKNVIHSIEI